MHLAIDVFKHKIYRAFRRNANFDEL